MKKKLVCVSFRYDHAKCKMQNAKFQNAKKKKDNKVKTNPKNTMKKYKRLCIDRIGKAEIIH